MSSIVQNILNQNVGDGARASKFEVLFEFTNPNASPSPMQAITMVKTAQFPGISHSIIDFKYKGRSIPLRGQTKYSQQWECSFYLTEDHALKHAFENWIVALDQQNTYIDATKEANISTTQSIHARKYTTTIHLFQKDFKDENVRSKYTLYNVFPIDVGAITYDYSAVGQIQEFTVQFAYSHFTVENISAEEGNFIDNVVGAFQSAARNIVNTTLNNIGNSINNFVGGAVGDTLNSLNNWSNGLTGGIVPNLPTNSIEQLASGRVGPQYLTSNITNVINSNISSVGNSVSKYVSNTVSDSINKLFKF